MKRWAANAALLIGSLLIAALLGEWGLRALLPKPNEGEIQAVEFRHEWKLNRYEFRDEEFESKLARGKPAVIFLGDSFVAGVGVDRSRSFASRLAGRYREDLEVFNLGHMITGSREHYEYLKTHIQTLRPKAVILFFYWNDVQDNFFFEWREPEFKKAIDEEMKRQVSFLGAFEPVKRWVSGSVLYRYLSSYYRIFLRQMGWAKFDYGFELDAFESPMRSDAVRTGWKQTEKWLRAMKALSQEHGASFRIVYVPKREQIFGWDKILRFYRLDPSRYDLMKTNEELKALARSLDIPLADVTDAFKHSSRPDKLYYKLDTHFTPYGHERFYELVAPALDEWLAEWRR